MSQQTERDDIKKKILSTGIRVGTEVKTKFMIPYITQAIPEGLYLLDLDITLSRIQTAARFIKKFDMNKVVVYSGRVYASTPIEKKSCNAAILKVNQAGSLYDALEFAKTAQSNDIKLITSHRSGESIDSQISHIGIGTNSKMLKVGVVGGERVAKLNELIRLSEHDLIRGMAEV